MEKKMRQKIFEKYDGHCAYCGCELNDKWQVDHAISKCYFFLIDPLNRNGVNAEFNLMPACKECNHYKRSLCVDNYEHHIGFRKYMMSFHKRLAKLPKKTIVVRTKERIIYMHKIADKYGIAVDKPFDGIFYFEKQIA